MPDPALEAVDDAVVFVETVEMARCRPWAGGEGEEGVAREVADLLLDWGEVENDMEEVLVGRPGDVGTPLSEVVAASGSGSAYASRSGAEGSLGVRGGAASDIA